MYNDAELYQLSFVAPSEKRRTKPGIVFTIQEKHLEEIVRRLRIIVPDWRSHAQMYCDPDAEFAPLAKDLFGHIEFGYDHCGFVTALGEEVSLHVELRKKKLQSCTLTIKLLTMALAVPIERQRRSNRPQQVDLEIRCDPSDLYGYNHAVGGYASSRLISYLRKLGSSDDPNKRTRVPHAVITAMRQTWKAVCKSDMRDWAKECDGYVTADGRFMLTCFGNACDLAIYPDGTCGNMSDPYVRFSCHNLDTAAQQVTLLVGLAKLCELARKEEKK